MGSVSEYQDSHALITFSPVRGDAGQCVAAAELNWRSFAGHGVMALHWPRACQFTGVKPEHRVESIIPGRGRSSRLCYGDNVWLTLAVEQGVVPTHGPDDMQNGPNMFRWKRSASTGEWK